MKKQNLDSKSLSRFLYWSDILYNSELFEKNVDMFDFVILDIDLALIRYRSWSWGYSAHAPSYYNYYFLKYLFFVFTTYLRYLYEYWDSNGWCNSVIGINKITDYHSIAVSQTNNDHI